MGTDDNGQAVQSGDLLDCPQCGGYGWVHGTAMDHAPGCDGTCRNCPVPVEVRDPCDVCGGCGQVQSNNMLCVKTEEKGAPFDEQLP